ncbi:entericidin [Parasphingorhabdus sp.]
MRNILAILMLSATFVLAACNTVQGVGEDIGSVGRAGEEVIN